MKLNCKSSHSSQEEQNITARFSKDIFHGIHPIDQWEVQGKRPHTQGDQNLTKKTQDKCEMYRLRITENNKWIGEIKLWTLESSHDTKIYSLRQAPGKK